MTTLKIGTRKSKLALWQTQRVAEALEAADGTLRCAVTPIITEGDRTQQAGIPLPAIGGKGLFTAELEQALRAGDIHLAVHSLKDLPVEDAPQIGVGAILARADVRDVLVAQNGWTLETLPHAAVIGTGSRRRAAQLLGLRPDLDIRPIRGNVGTRISKVLDENLYDATVLAAAGVERLGLESKISAYLSLEAMLPAPGQGAIAVQWSPEVHTNGLKQALAQIDDAPTRLAVTAERAFLHALGGGCSTPVAAYATAAPNGDINLQGLVLSLDGKQQICVASRGREPHRLGKKLAEQALAQGAAEILQAAQ